MKLRSPGEITAGELEKKIPVPVSEGFFHFGVLFQALSHLLV
jgi:hypothetical protein